MAVVMTQRFQRWIVFFFTVGIFGIVGCDSGFGEPCAIPKTEAFRQACEDSAGGQDESEDETSIMMSSTASCAIRNYAGCSTRVCLVYKGSDPICSTTCNADGDCEGSARCRPLIGDEYVDGVTCNPEMGGTNECYCVRKGDVNG
ncbi:MAG: hypothetical protein CMH52_13355 [Myxococcales bacterium]|nr:hypothetical protein [Myxococcales bacterium]|tara:strand:+ start:837 stop:1271 length:435 start_codon:yes stop_codon:yes gene_type:complete